VQFCKTPAVVFSLGKEKSKGASTAAPAAHAAVRCCRAGRQPGGADYRLAAAGLSPKAIEASTELVADGPDHAVQSAVLGGRTAPRLVKKGFVDAASDEASS